MREVVLAMAVLAACATSALSQSLDQQERCAQQARRAYEKIEADKVALNKRLGNELLSMNYQSHYNTKHGKCLMLVQTTERVVGLLRITELLTDANERRQYAYYVWLQEDNQQSSEVPPRTCVLTPSLRDRKDCASSKEFDEFVAPYIEE
jgi:hypothetical protein